MKLQLDAEDLEPLIRRVVEETLARVSQESAKLNGRLAYSEEEAAELLGIDQHVLRDERLRGRIKASKIVANRVRYLREDLIAYVLGRRVEK